MLDSKYKKIHILSNPRTASTYLFQTINSYWFDLPHDEWRRDFNEPYRHNTDVPAKTKSIKATPKCAIKNHVIDLEYCESHKPTMTMLRKADYTIALLRRDNFEAALSLATSVTTQDWVRVTVTDPVTVDPLTFLDCYKNNFLRQLRLIENPWGFKYNKILFTEELGTRPRFTIKQTGLQLADGFLKYKPNPIPRMLDKTTHVENYQQLKDLAIFYKDELRQYVPDNVEVDDNFRMRIGDIT